MRYPRCRFGQDQAGGLDTVDAGHADVHQDHIGVQEPCLGLREHDPTPLVTTSPNLPGTAWIISQLSTRDGRFAFVGRPPGSLIDRLCSSVPPGPRAASLRREHSRSVSLSTATRVGPTMSRQPVLALPVDRGRLAARAVSAAHRRNGLAGPPPRRLIHTAMRPRRITPPAVVVLLAAGAQQRGPQFGPPVADLVAVPGGGDQACVAEGEQVAETPAGLSPVIAASAVVDWGWSKAGQDTGAGMAEQPA